MTPSRLCLALILWIFAAPFAPAGAKENGGTGILRAYYSLEVEDDGCKTLAYVTSREEIRRITEQIYNAEGPMTFYVRKSRTKLRLQPRDGDHLVGRVLGSGRRVIVMSEEYAARNGL